MNIPKMIEDCEATTPGPWKISRVSVTTVASDAIRHDRSICSTGGYANNWDGGKYVDENEANAAHIARFDPIACKAILELLETWDEWYAAALEELGGKEFQARNQMLKARRKLEELLK